MSKKDRKPTPSDRNQARANAGNRKRRRRHGRYIIHYALLILLVLGIGLALSMTVFFKIESIEVQGDSPYTQEELTRKAHNYELEECPGKDFGKGCHPGAGRSLAHCGA